ncbi:hypothetical protein D3C87_1670190 [compost metagenome]
MIVPLDVEKLFPVPQAAQRVVHNRVVAELVGVGIVGVEVMHLSAHGNRSLQRVFQGQRVAANRLDHGREIQAARRDIANQLVDLQLGAVRYG